MNIIRSLKNVKNQFTHFVLTRGNVLVFKYNNGLMQESGPKMQNSRSELQAHNTLFLTWFPVIIRIR